jgi:hypothetical protein
MKGVKALFLQILPHPDNTTKTYPIDLKGIFPSLKYLLLCNMSLHLLKPVLPQHPLHTITFSSMLLSKVFYHSILPPQEHQWQKPVKLYLRAEKQLLENFKFVERLEHAGIQVMDRHRHHVV